MPTVPQYGGFQVGQNTLPQPRLDAPQMVNDAGQQAQQLGGAMSSASIDMGRIAQDMAEQMNQARQQDAATQGWKLYTDLSVQANQIKGKAAMDGIDGQYLPDAFVGKLNDGLQSISQGLGNDAQRQAFSQISARMKQEMYSGLSQHVAQQTGVYLNQNDDATQQVAMQSGAAQPTDELGFQRALNAIESTNRAKVMRNGGDEQIASVTFGKLKDAAYQNRYKAWERTDPVAALANFQANQEQVQPIMRNAIGYELFRASARSLAITIGPWIVGAGAAPINASSDQANMPRNERNNNPLNIRLGDSKWQGAVAGSDPNFVTFSTPEAGIRAGVRLLQTYDNKYGLNTVAGIISKWAPAGDNNDTQGYISTVSKALGVNQNDRLDLRDPNTLTTMVKAMTKVEGGRQPYSDAQISAGINSAFGNGQLPTTAVTTDTRGRDDQGRFATNMAAAPAWRDPNAMSGDPIVDKLPPDQRAIVYALAHSQMQQGMTQLRDALNSRVRDSTAEYLTNGTASNPPTEDEFIQAYGQLDGVRRYRELADTAALGSNLQQTITLSNDDMDKMLANTKPAPGEGFAVRERNYQILSKAVEQTADAREKDPVHFALQNPAFGIQPIQNPGDMNALIDQVGKRKDAMYRISSDYGTPPALLTNTEAHNLGAYLDTLQTPDKARVLGDIAAAGGDVGMYSIAAQLKDKHNTLGIAAALAAYTTDPATHWFGPATPGANVGQMYLEGKDAIAQKLVKIDDQAEFGANANIYKAIAGVYLSPQERDATAEAAFGIYGKLKADGNDNINQAIKYATGGIMQFNGGSIAKPYGWNDGKFTDAMSNTVPKAIKSTGGQYLSKGQKIGADDLAKMLPGARLQTWGNGSYLIMNGNDPVRNRDGSPYILNVGAMASPNSGTYSDPRTGAW